jgi:hypothetical protein
MTATKAPAQRPTARKAAKPKPQKAPANGSEHYEPPTQIRPPEEFKAEKPTPAHPIYGDKPLYTYRPQDGSEPIEFPHISTCRPDPLFFYDNRHRDEMHQAFAWMDLCGIPDPIGRRLFQLPDHEQATLLREWFGGLNLTPQAGVTPPGE